MKIVPRPVKVNTSNAEINKMLLGKELSEWEQRTSKLLAKMWQAYNFILR